MTRSTSAPDAAMGATSPASAASSIGDVVLTFGAGGPPSRSRRGTAWLRASGGPYWTMWSEEASFGAGWKGMPAMTLELGAWRVWLLGELYGLPSRASVEAAALGVATLRDAPTDLNGHFLLLAWDGLRQQWHLWTDRFGTLHAYFGSDGRQAAIGTYFPAVAHAASRRTLDWQTLTGFFGFGYFPADRTFFDDVRILEPASHYVFGSRGALERHERYWTWGHAPDGARSYDDTVDEFAGRWRTVMTELGGAGRVALPISGGLDSRSTVAALNSAPTGIWSFSYGYGDRSIETAIARDVARARRLPFSRFTINEYLFDRLRLILNSTEAFQDLTQCRQAVVLPELTERADRVICAHWGDVWLDAAGAADVAHDDGAMAKYLYGRVAKRGRAWLLRELCQPHTGTAPVEALLFGQVVDGLRRIDRFDDPDARLKAYKTERWSFRWTLASLRMYQPAAFPRLPFYDARLADFFSTVPTSYLRGRRLQKDYLRRFAPDLASIRWQTSGMNLYENRGARAAALTRRVWRRARRAVGGRGVPERNWEIQLTSARARRDLGHWLTRPSLRLHDLVSRAAVQDVTDRFHARPDAANGYCISMLLTFSVWLEEHA